MVEAAILWSVYVLVSLRWSKPASMYLAVSIAQNSVPLSLGRKSTLNNLRIGLYKRYVDDILILAKNKQQAKEIHEILNNANEHIQFEIEHPEPNTNKLSLLDFSIEINQSNGESTTEFFKKTAKKDLFVNFHSAIPTKTKEHYIKNEIRRIESRCTHQEDKVKHTENFKRILKMNDYPRETIKNIITKKNNENTHNVLPPSDRKFFLQFPYLNDAMDRRIKNIFKKEGLNVKIYRKSQNLRQVLSKKKTKPCKKKNCTINNEDCLKKKCIYETTCSECNNTYLGSTIRPLHERAKEHEGTSSSVYKHRQTCGGSFRFRVIDTANDITELRYKEAIYIKKRRPEINTKQEAEDLSHLTF